MTLLDQIRLIFSRGLQREERLRRVEAERERKIIERERKEERKTLEREAKLYERLIQDSLLTQGEGYFPRSQGLPTVKKTRPGKVQRVKFDRIFTTPERIYFKIAINKRTVFGTKNVLPYNVTIRSITSEDTLWELSWACERKVSARIVDSRKGAWLIVDRLEGMGGLPNLVYFHDPTFLNKYPEKDSDKGYMILGIGEYRLPHIVNLVKFPHVLVGGTTGSGKSNTVNSLICGFIRNTDPKEFKIILVDLKRLEFAFYKGIPHLMRPTISTIEEVLETLQFLANLMESRTKLLEGKASELAEWNRRYPKQKQPRIMMLIDEFGEIMHNGDKKLARECERLIVRITGIGRAIGIHILICTQRPAVSVVTGDIKANMPLIIAGRTPNRHHSAVILDDAGASQIADIPGRMIYRGNSADQTIQAPLIRREDIFESIRISKGRGAGVITLKQGVPRILPNGLTLYIADCLQGWLDKASIWKAVKQFAVSQRELAAFLEEFRNRREIQIGKRIFDIRKQGQRWRLMERFEMQVMNPAISGSHYPQLAAPTYDSEPVIILGTSSEQQPVTPVESSPAPEPEIIVGEAMIIGDIDSFLRRRCVQGPKQSILFRDLYNAYLADCDASTLAPMPERTFAIALKSRQFESKPFGAKKLKKIHGLGLLPTQPEPESITIGSDNEN